MVRMSRPNGTTPSRLFADRRAGIDQRSAPRRRTQTRVPSERRTSVDRRRGPERRSTLDRRGRAARQPSAESPGEHLRNALQLLTAAEAADHSDADRRADLAAALDRLHRALSLLERRVSTGDANK